MKMGTKSLLFGAHQFIYHPIAVALAWYKLFGFRKVHWFPTGDLPDLPYSFGAVSLINPMLWIAFIIHDWGYWGLDRMDDDRGEMHPRWAGTGMYLIAKFFRSDRGFWWSLFMEGHSRYLSRKLRIDPSPLCAADKMSMAFTPAWLYVVSTRWTGEIREYQGAEKHADMHSYVDESTVNHTFEEDVQWYNNARHHITLWAEAYANGLRIKYPPNRETKTEGAGRETNQVHQNSR